MRGRRLPRLAVALAALALPLLLAACAGDGEEGAATATVTTGATPAPPSQIGTAEQPPATTTTTETSVLVYLIRDEKVGVARRTVPRTRAVGAAALRELLEGPTPAERDAGLGTLIPEGTRLLGLEVRAGTATVDLSGEFVTGGGSLSMLGRVAQVVYTLTQFPSVRRVRFAVDGEPVEAIGGEGVAVEPPVDRADFEELAPAILVESPAPWDTVTSPIRLRGTANTFEATFRAEVRDASGRTVGEATVTATAGSGTRGTFDARIRYAAPQPGEGTLRVFELSAEDGRPINVVELPIRLE